MYYSIGQKGKGKRLNHFLLVSTNFNKTSMAETHIGSDYFPQTTSYLPLAKD